MTDRAARSIADFFRDFIPQRVPDTLAFCEFECREWRCPKTGEICPHNPDDTLGRAMAEGR